ncbi:MAG: VIT1/CCC1 transporter family protein [archaeon]
MLLKFLKKIAKNDIIRRYVVMNSFDGGLTILGIVLVSFFAGVTDPHYIILPSVGAGIAMCISGMWGAYAAEKAELTRSRKEMEKHMLRKLHNTIMVRKKETMAIIIAIVDGVSPMLVAFLIISPFFFVYTDMLSIAYAYYTSIAIVAIILFLLGVFTGKISQEPVLKHGVIMLLAGLVIAVIFYVMMLAGLV